VYERSTMLPSSSAVGKIIADDEKVCTEVASRLMRRLGYDVTVVTDGALALESVARDVPDVILLDVEMPRIDGFEVCRRLKASSCTRLIPVILVTGLTATEDRIRGIEAGTDDFLSKPFHAEEIEARVRSLTRVKRYTDELESAECVILSLALTIEARDPYTKGHCERLARYATVLGRQLGLASDEIAALYRGGYLHDIGKIAIPDKVLFKRSSLSSGEFALMRQHTVIGDNLCLPMHSLRLVRPIVRHHHERLDGSGYPDGLCGNEIPLLAQIVGVVDAYDAMTTTRPYRQAWPAERALEELWDDVEEGLKSRELVDVFITLGRRGDLAEGT